MGLCTSENLRAELMFEMERHGLDIGGHPVFLKEISGSKTDYIYSQNHK